MAALLEKPAFLIVIVLILLLFGAKRLPDLARGVGRSARIFKAETEGLRGDTSDDDAGAEGVLGSQPPRSLVDPVTGERLLAQPIHPPAE